MNDHLERELTAKKLNYYVYKDEVNGMVYKLYCIKDECVGFVPPMAMENDNVAKRSFEHICSAPDSLYQTRPQDYSLYCVGDFNNVTGEIVPLLPFRVCEASDYVR